MSEEVEQIIEMARDFSNATDSEEAFFAEYSLRKAVEALVADRDKLKAELEKLQDRDPVSRDNGVKMTEVEKIMSLADEYGACHGDIDHDGENWIDLWVEPRKKLQEAVEELVKGRDGWKKEALHHAQQHSYYKQRTVDIEAGAKALVQERDGWKEQAEQYCELCNEAKVLIEAKAQVQQEPFGFIRPDFVWGGRSQETMKITRRAQAEYLHTKPLYAAPVNDKLREAAQKVLDFLRGEVEPVPGGLLAYDGAIESLLEALEAMK